MHLFNSHFFGLSFPLSSVFALSHGGEISLLQRPDDVQTRPLRSDTRKKSLSRSLSPCLSLCAVQKETKRQSLQRLSIALASHLLFSHDSDPPTPGISSFPTGDSASLGHIIKSVWGTRSTSSGATPLSTSQCHNLKKYKSNNTHTHTRSTLP